MQNLGSAASPDTNEASTQHTAAVEHRATLGRWNLRHQPSSPARASKLSRRRSSPVRRVASASRRRCPAFREPGCEFLRLRRRARTSTKAAAEELEQEDVCFSRSNPRGHEALDLRHLGRCDACLRPLRHLRAVRQAQVTAKPLAHVREASLAGQYQRLLAYYYSSSVQVTAPSRPRYRRGTGMLLAELLATSARGPCWHLRLVFY